MWVKTEPGAELLEVWIRANREGDDPDPGPAMTSDLWTVSANQMEEVKNCLG